MDPAVRVTETKIELVDDTQVLNEDFKKNVAIPYFKDIYKDLVQQSDNKSKGINKLSILTVSGREIPPFSPKQLQQLCYFVASIPRGHLLRSLSHILLE